MNGLSYTNSLMLAMNKYLSFLIFVWTWPAFKMNLYASRWQAIPAARIIYSSGPEHHISTYYFSFSVTDVRVLRE